MTSSEVAELMVKAEYERVRSLYGFKVKHAGQVKIVEKGVARDE